MLILGLGAFAFFATHVCLASNPVRGMLVGSMGVNAFRGVYSLIAFVTLGLLIYAYVRVPHSEFLWLPNPLMSAVTRALMLPAIILLALGIMTRNPTSLIAESSIGGDIPGIVKITRHPIQWAILLWSICHILANGDLASLLFFGSFGLTSAVGTISMDRKNAARPEDAWRVFHEQTGNVPFTALIAGRTTMSLGELNWVAAAVGAGSYVAIYWFHAYIAGVSLV